jgi:hypothetical protein
MMVDGVLHIVMGAETEGSRGLVYESGRRTIRSTLSTKNLISLGNISPRTGPQKWKEIHSYAGNDPSWLELWELTLPSFGCGCRDGYKDFKMRNPPDFSTPETFWNWGWYLHNWVNEKLGKPLLSHEEARKLWRPDNGCKEDCCENNCRGNVREVS